MKGDLVKNERLSLRLEENSRVQETGDVLVESRKNSRKLEDETESRVKDNLIREETEEGFSSCSCDRDLNPSTI